MGAASRVAALAAGAALALSACGSSSDSDSDKAAKPVGEVLVGSVAQMAQCSDWTGAERAQRLATIHDIKQQVNLKDSAVQTPELSDEAAYRVLDNTCRRGFARGFRLYKLYARATSFASFAGQ